MEGFEVMVTVTFLQFKLGSMETDTFVNIFGVGFHRRVGTQLVTVTYLQLMLGSMDADMFVNIYGVGFRRLTAIG